MVFTLTNHGGRTIIKKTGSITAFLLTLCLVKERGSSVEIRIPIFGARFNPIFCLSDVIFQPFPDLTPETVRKQNKGG